MADIPEVQGLVLFEHYEKDGNLHRQAAEKVLR